MSSTPPSDRAQQLHRQAMAAFEAGRADDALALMQQSIDLAPQSAVFRSNFGILCRLLGRMDEAIAHWRRALDLDPDHPDAHINLAAALRERGEIDASMFHGRRAMEISRRPESYLNFAAALVARERLHEAETVLRELLSYFPGDAQAMANLAWVLRRQGHLTEAIELWRQCVRANPRHAHAWNDLGSAMMDIGRFDDALHAYRTAIDAAPDLAAAHSNYVYAIHFDPNRDAASILAEYREWDRVHAQPLRSQWRKHDNDRDPDRPLRIAYLSPDLREHSVGRAMLPIMSCHDAAQFEVICYSDATTHDDVTAQLRNRAHAWNDTAALSDAELAEKIRADRIDILIDLAQHMAANRMLTLARKPAPVQATHIGYPATTGVAAIDCRITDRFLDPPGETEAFNSEQLIRLPNSFFCYRGVDVPLSPLAASRANHLTFASLNTPFKTSDAAIDLWSRVLSAVSSSRLLISAPTAASDDLRRRYAQHGIDPTRLDILPRQPIAQYFRLYDRIDIALDTIPYNGGVTTCDALWMGVPVVSLRGTTSVGRAGESILTNLDLPNLLASSRDQFVDIAANLAHDRDALTNLRQTLRDRMQRSPICNEPQYVRDLEAAYRTMWQNRCASPL